MRRTVGLALGASLVLACLCISAATAAWLRADGWLGRPASAPAATLAPTSQSATPLDTVQVLAAAVVPPRDSRALAMQLRPAVGTIPLVVNPDPPQHAVGDKARFWVSNSDSLEMFQVTATLRVISEHTEMWVEDGVPVDRQGLELAAKAFDESIYATVHNHFGSEWSPGVDNNPRVVVLNARFDGAAGYYSSHDEFSHLVNPYSNEREMFYMNVDAATPGTERYAAILAHEFQHMVHWQLDSNEDSWVNEGASELASRVSGYGPSGAVAAFAQRPDTQLNAWSMDPDENTLPHYGASYLWAEYFLQTQGTEALKAVMAEPANGIEGFEKVLDTMPDAQSFDDLFADWVVANVLDDSSLRDGRYGHEAIDPHVVVETTYSGQPIRETGTVNQYGTDYVNLVPRSGGVEIEFTGDSTVAVVPNTAYGGRYQWWSNRGDMSDTTLTRAFDLSAVSEATLQYALWHELEDGWDYGYVEVSTDDGATWTLLTTEHTTDYNPNGNAFGPGYTGFSGHAAGSNARLEPRWIREKVDLTPYAGKRILVRFEVISDDAVNLPGMCLDDISVPQLGFEDNAEGEVEGWEAQGFVRMDNELPQAFLVQVIELGRQIKIQQLPLNESQRGTVTIEGFGGDVQRAVIAISGLTRHTTEPARYSCTIRPLSGAR